MPEKTREILEGVQFLINKWESKEISDEMALALIEVHLERESSLKRQESSA